MIVLSIRLAVIREFRGPFRETTIQAVDLGKSLLGKVGASALAHVAVVTADDEGNVQISLVDEVLHTGVVEVYRVGNMRHPEAVRVPDIHDIGWPVDDHLVGIIR